MACLVDLATQRRYPIGDRIIVGRAASCGVQLDDPMVSAEHAEISRAGDGTFRVRDLGSRRGTFVGTRKIDEATLTNADELLIGPMRLRLELPRNDDDELRRLRAIAELARAIGAEHDLDRLLDRVLATCFQLLRADRAMIIVYPPGSKTPCATVARTRDGAVADALSTTLLSQLMATHEPYLRTEIDSDLALQRSASLSAQGVRSVAAVPLLYDTTEWLGVLHVDAIATNNIFGARDLEVVADIASQAVLAIKNALLVRHLQSARDAELRRLERLVINLPVGVVVIDDRKQCVLANDWVRARADAIGSLAAGVPVDAIAGVATEQLLTDGRAQARVGSPERTFALAAHTALDDAETVVVIHEITEEWARLTKAAHQERLALVGQLAGGIAHDFNNLLCVVINYAMMLEDTIDASDVREDLAAIIHAGRSAANLVRQLLAFSRREVVRPRVVDLAGLVREIEPVLRRAVGDQVTLAIDAQPGTPDVLIAPSQVEQIVLNLVVNARDAMPDGGSVTVRLSPRGNFAAIEVIDTGVGMPPEVMRRVFEPYFTTKPRGKGTGLGLATVHGIVQHACGEIAVSSEPGRGTTFRALLPKTDQQREGTASVAPLRKLGGRVLLVDDDTGVRRMAERIIKRAGYDVFVASSGIEALATLRREAVDLLLTDMVMPGMSGRDLARQVMREHPHVKVLFMSGYHPGAPIRGGRFIAKPFDRDELVARIGDALADDIQRPATA